MKAGGDTSSDLLNLQVVNADGQMEFLWENAHHQPWQNQPNRTDLMKWDG